MARMQVGQLIEKNYSGKYSRRIFKGIGHSVPQEAPEAFAQAAIDVDAFS
jgi:pimeloyl-ACP methyl ester carboxylesterase